MIRAYKVLLIVSLMLFGIWGCSKAGPTAENPQTLARLAKLEHDLKSALAAQDAIRMRLSSAEDQLRRELERTVALERERNDLKAKLKEKSAERDDVAMQYDTFRKNIRQLLGNADIAMQPKSESDVPTATVSLPKGPLPSSSGS